jgi:protein-disulfide isomerase
MDEKAKINPYLIIIVILIIIIAGFTYNQWGKKIFPASIETPDKDNVTIELFEDDIEIGNENALVTIVEYFGYLCGYCKRHHDDTYPKIFKDYISTGKVKYVLRVFPFRNEDIILGSAGLCANDQGKFLEYHNKLFKEVNNIQATDDLKDFAKEINLDEEQFNQCFDSEKYISKVQAWRDQGDEDFEQAGVSENQRGTPAFFINGELLIGAQPYEIFVEVIEKKLAE